MKNSFKFNTLVLVVGFLFTSVAHANPMLFSIGNFKFWIDLSSQKAMTMNGDSRCHGQIDIKSFPGIKNLRRARVVTLDFSKDHTGIACNNFTMSLILNESSIKRARIGKTTYAQMSGTSTFGFLRPVKIVRLK